MEWIIHPILPIISPSPGPLICRLLVWSLHCWHVQHSWWLQGTLKEIFLQWWYVCSYSCWIVKGLRCSIILFKFEKSPTISNFRNFESTGGYNQMFPTYFVYFLIWHFNFASLAHLVFPSPSGRLLEHNKYPVSVAIYPLDAWLKEGFLWQGDGKYREVLSTHCCRGNRMVWVAPLGSETCFQSELCTSAFPCSSLHGVLDGGFFWITWGRGKHCWCCWWEKNRYPFPRSDLETEGTHSFLNLCFVIPIFFVVSRWEALEWKPVHYPSSHRHLQRNLGGDPVFSELGWIERIDFHVHPQSPT